MSEYPKYPIYKVIFWWAEKDTKNKDLTPYQKKLCLKKGEIDNGYSYKIIKKQVMTPEEINDFMSERILKYSKEHKIIRFIESSIKLIGYESWVCDYFCHKTFKIENKDNQWYLDNFEDYVSRKENENEISLIEGCDDRKWDGLTPIPKHQLMGADERWRWRGENEGDEPPCKCKHCLDSEYVYINH